MGFNKGDGSGGSSGSCTGDLWVVGVTRAVG